MIFEDRIDNAFPAPWHIERDGDVWQVWDCAGHVAAETAGEDADVLNEKAAAIVMSKAPEMYALLCEMAHEGIYNPRQAAKFFELRAEMYRAFLGSSDDEV